MFKKLQVRLAIYGNYLKVLMRKGITGARRSREIKVAFFDLIDLRQEPYYFPIIYALHEAGYNILIANRPLFIGHIFGPGKFIYELKNLKIAAGTANKSAIFITDNPKKLHAANGRNFIYLNFRYLERDQKTVLPYPLHPDIYHRQLYLQCQKLRKQSRLCRVVFSGNTEPLAYQSDVLKRHFHGLNRVQIVDSIIKNFNSQVLRINSGKERKMPEEQAYFKGIVVNGWKWSKTYKENMEVKISIQDWLPFLASADFFLACPGVSIPFSHNAIEAMSVGTIPILNYAQSFSPALEDGKNCIAFTTEANLLKRLDEVLAMSEEEIAALRQNVISYYETNLNYLKVIPRLFIETKTPKEFLFINEAV